MDKKKKSKANQTKNTSDIRSFFNRMPVTKLDDKPIKNGSATISSSDDESPIKKNLTQFKKVDKMAKRKIFESSSDEEVIHKSKKSKLSIKSEKSVPSKTKEPKKESKSRKKKKDESDDDEYEPIEDKSISKKATNSKKATTTKKEATTKKSTSTKKETKSSKTKAIKSKSTVRPLDEESDEDALECELVKKNKMQVQVGFNFKNKPNLSKMNGDKMKTGEMWVDKYKPTNVKQVIGQHTNKSSANKLKHWLENWYENKDYPVKFGAKNDTGIGLRAALLSGCPGIGKTTTAQLIAKECGFEFVEFNASDTRNKKSMDEQIPTLLNNKTLDGYVHDSHNKTKMTDKHLLIMDEVDGMAGNADRGGVAELIKFIRKTEIPIICICNDRNNAKIRNLANYCFDLRFSKPRVDAIKNMVLDICKKENVKVSSDLLSEIIEMSNHDIRQVIHYVSVFATKNQSLSDVKDNKIIKDVTLGPFDAVKKMFTDSAEYHNMSMREKSNLFFNDYQLLPLFAWENYSQCKPSKTQTGVETLAMAAKSIDAICIGDMIETQIRTTQNWSLLPFQSIFSCVMPGHYMNGHFQNMIQFPSLLGKISSTNKKDRLVQELKQHMNLKITGSKTCLNLDYILPLRDKIIQPLIKLGNDGIDSAIETLMHYSLLKDDLDSIIELSLYGGEKSPYLKVDTKTKSALTRNYNKAINPFPYAVKDQIKKLGKGESGKKKDSDFAKDEEDAKEEEMNASDEELLPEF